jgi:uncharacterized protein (UPF0264 family)
MLKCSYRTSIPTGEQKMKLMISVVNAVEAREALAGGAEILDVKNPGEGSLGAQPPWVIAEIKGLAPAEVQVSAAAGDMPDLPGTAALAALGAALCGADFVKVGLFGPRTPEPALRLLQTVRRALETLSTLPAGGALRMQPVALIAGAYADFERAGTLDPRLLPRLAAEAGAQGCLLDTAIKDGRCLLDSFSLDQLHSLCAEAHAAGLLFAAAGALGEQHLALLAAVGVDVVGVRTAACRDGFRSGGLDAERVKRLHHVLTCVRGNLPRSPV